jgi:DNA-binding transcriptional ArsR family regulator
MNLVDPVRMVEWLRAAGEPTRLRLLALITQGELSVSDLAAAVGQSEPRVSRHLRILTEAGLTERQRQGQWVHYRLTAAPESAAFVRGLLAQLDRRDGRLAQDRSAAHSALVADTAGASGESRLGRALAALVGADAHEGLGAALVVGVTHPELLRASAPAARSCVALAGSRRAAQAARAYAERCGLTCRVLEASPGSGLNETDVARAGGRFDLILLDRPAADDAALTRTLDVARRALSAQGRLWLFEGYEALENSRARVIEHPLARLRRLLAESGFRCERISPLEADGEHVLAVSAQRAAAPGAQERAHGGASA